MRIPQIISKLVKSLAYIGAALVILLAIAVGIFRLLLPRLPAYQEEIKTWANAAIGMQVQFADMNARWRLSGPELTFRDAELTPYDQSSSLLKAGEVSVGVSLLRLMQDRVLVVDRIEINNSRLTFQKTVDGEWIVQGRPLSDLIAPRDVATGRGPNMTVVANNVAVEYRLPDGENSLDILLKKLEFSKTDDSLKIDAAIDLPDSLGTELTLAATQYAEDAGNGVWQLFVEARHLVLPGFAELDPSRIPEFETGMLDLSASFQFSSAGLENAAADFVLNDVVGASSVTKEAADAQGRVEFSKDGDGWMIAVSNFVLNTVNGAWPRSSLSLQVAQSQSAPMNGFTLSATYLNLDDLPFFDEWTPTIYKEKIASLALSGALRELRVNIEDIESDVPRFDVASSMDMAGIAASDTWPGVRNFSGLLRANNSGGMVEIKSDGIVVDLTSYLPEPITFDDAVGTVIWRRNALGITVLSDSVRIRNTDLDSNTSLQITLPAGGQAPHVDIQSRWSVNDVSSVKRYLPARLIKPRLYQWLSEALVAGNAPSGNLQLTGPLDKFPFDEGEGVFRAEGHLENTILRYSDLWPDARNMTLDVVVDGMHLYSRKNTANNAGNTVVDANIDIPDLRRPILNIDAFATGSLETIRDFSRQSPIARVFGGHLDDVLVHGDASFRLQLSYPILDRDKYDFSTRLQASNGSMTFDGFRPALTELNGYVTVTREGVSSESLFGQFLGQPVNIELKPGGDEDPDSSVVAEVTGRLTDTGLIAELAPQLEGIVSGASDYRAKILFPKTGVEPATSFRILVRSELEGMKVKLPDPIAKAADEVVPIEFAIEFPVKGRINTSGSYADDIRWSMSFLSEAETGWALDRGVLAAGIDPLPQAEFSGLHIVGATDVVIFDEWLDLARRAKGNGQFTAAIRSLDLDIGHLHIIGQDLQDHRVQVQRSAQDWLVTINGQHATGNISVPYDFTSGRPMVFDMDTLILPGDDSDLSSPDEALPDPRALPPLSIKTKNFGLDERSFGALTAELARTPRGLESTVMSTRDDSYTVEGSAGWVIDDEDSTGQRTYLSARLVSTDIRQTMDRLGYYPGIEGNDLTIALDVGWSGSPDKDFLERLDGTVALGIGSGQLDDVDPGAGRVFGLLSVVALPRRLSLDFKDVFEKGFGFDKINGTFRIEKGDAFTCDLSLEGPAADVGIVGRAGLASRDYDQAAVVNANVGNTLPIIGGLVAGPQVAAALLIFSQIFKKPLQEAGQVYYGIGGSWDTPDISPRNDADFAAVSRQAGCISVTE